MVQIVERIQAHYESREMPFGKVYEWHPAAVDLECDCGEKVTLNATSSTTTMMRPLIPKARAGVTRILRRPPTRSEPKGKKSHASRTNRQRDGAGGSLEAGEGPRPENWRTVRRGA